MPPMNVYGPTAAQVAVSSRVPKRMSAIDAMVSGTQNETMPSAVGLPMRESAWKLGSSLVSRY